MLAVKTPATPLFIDPYEPPFMTIVLSDENSKLFASVIRASQVSRVDLGDDEITFLVPRDATCSSAERAYLEGLKSRDAARAYVLSHSFRGQLAIYRENERLKRVTYFPRTGSEDGRVVIDVTHPFEMTLLNGEPATVFVNETGLHVGFSNTVVDNFSQGGSGIVYLDHCARL